MMVGQANEISRLLSELNTTTTQIRKLEKKKQMKQILEQDITGLLQNLEELNYDLNTERPTTFWDDKSFELETIEKTLQEAIETVQIFENNQPDKNKTAQKNVNETIVGLFSVLNSEIETFSKNLKRNLQQIKNHRIGRKIEGPSKGDTFKR